MCTVGAGFPFIYQPGFDRIVWSVFLSVLRDVVAVVYFGPSLLCKTCVMHGQCSCDASNERIKIIKE